MSFSVLPSPAVSFIGRKNSGKTTLLEKVIAYLSEKGLRIATIKHHGHPDFDIDIPGRDSYRHRAAGAQSATILSDVRFAQVTELSHPLTCEKVISSLTSYDLVLVEGFKQAAIPHIELFRKDNPRDQEATRTLTEKWGKAPQTKDEEVSRQETLPSAVVTDIASVEVLTQRYHIPCFSYDDIQSLARFVQATFARPQLSVVVQAGGESKRMGTPKEVVPFLGKPLICHVLERVAPLADELIVTTNNPERLSFLKELYPHIRFASDQLEQRGAIPGLYSALSAAQRNLVAVVACDMVDFPTALLVNEALLLRPCCHPELDAVIPKTEHGIEPFAGVYKKETCLSELQRFINLGNTTARVRTFLEELTCGYIDCTSTMKCARFGGSFTNINTPQELDTAQRLLCREPDCLL